MLACFIAVHVAQQPLFEHMPPAQVHCTSQSDDPIVRIARWVRDAPAILKIFTLHALNDRAELVYYGCGVPRRLSVLFNPRFFGRHPL